MNIHPRPMAPSLYIQNEGEPISAKVATTLAVAPTRTVVRLTGGCGKLSDADARGVENLIVPAFADFSGALLFGGTRMVLRDKPHRVHWGITELAPLIRKQNPEARVVGVVARDEATDLRLEPGIGLVVAADAGNPWATIVHPEQSVCVILQHSADRGSIWDTEWQVCREITEILRDMAGFRHILLAYNGGGVTRNEVTAWADAGWPVIITAGSGRTCDELAADDAWLDAHPSVRVADKTTSSIRQHLISGGALPPGTREFRLLMHGA